MEKRRGGKFEARKEGQEKNLGAREGRLEPRWESDKQVRGDWGGGHKIRGKMGGKKGGLARIRRGQAAIGGKSRARKESTSKPSFLTLLAAATLWNPAN